ncbi:MAG: NapC/NirT family cytochrome c [Desulfuromonadaceae bacterium]|nr:NapC/NirT family cytochrome c [Desulfuromonadaceae bacterium]
MEQRKDHRKTISAEKYYMNVVSLLGMLTSAISALMIAIFLALQAFRGFENPYLELVTFFLLPGGILFGGVLTYLGAWRARINHRKNPDLGLPPLPRLDFNDPRKLRLAGFFALVTVVFFFVIVIASIKGFEFSESTTFCGEVCHLQMEPEHTAWRESAHARVRCVECHVGSGLDYYLKAKLNGTRQLYSVLTDTYPAPIPTPIHNLRPARGTCERCHWPQKFISARYKLFSHNAPNEENSRREIQMLIKIGGTPGAPNSSGIHWHIGKEVNYLATDEKRMNIPYISVKRKDGSLDEFVSIDKPFKKEEVEKYGKRLMDCIDCHNRPAHSYHPPSEELDHAFEAGKLDPALPFLKKIAGELLEKQYKSKEEATATINKGVNEYYAKNYAPLAASRAASIKQAIEEIQRIYSRNYFPRMKVVWSAYPTHMGHFYFPGCFRCHDGKHKNAAGRVISKDCNLCHTVISQIQENIPKGTQVKQFVHPVDIGDDLNITNCSDCHTPNSVDVTGGADEQKKQR